MESECVWYVIADLGTENSKCKKKVVALLPEGQLTAFDESRPISTLGELKNTDCKLLNSAEMTIFTQ